MPGFNLSAQQKLATAIKEEARRLGFSFCGIAEATQLDDEAHRLEKWLSDGRNGTMQWMENHFDKRIDPRKLVDDAKSVISLLFNYNHPEKRENDPNIGKISQYAWGEDYHFVLKDKLYELYNWIDEEVGGISGRVFTDSAPVMDKAWAQRSGLGWQGKHSNLINRNMGSYFFIAELIIDVPLPADNITGDYCGSCTRCIDACPTDAIIEPYVVDANKCISYLTIEYREKDLPAEMTANFDGWIFGCDICQDVCPWNKFKKPQQEPRFDARPEIINKPISEWLELDIEEFRRLFKKNPVKRTKYDGLMRNIKAIARN